MSAVLIIDDDPDCAEVLGEILRAEGHDTRIAYNGIEGLRLAEERRPDIAVLDVEMPILDGPTTAHEMFVRDRGLELVPIVLLSGATSLRDVAAQIGTPYFLPKPYRYEAVMRLIRRALAERQSPHPAAQGAPSPSAPPTP